jgi:thiamine-monophosphate kinase
MSKRGAEIIKEKIPISRNTFKLAEKLKKNAYAFALHGGEDFELVFTIPKEKLRKISLY